MKFEHDRAASVEGFGPEAAHRFARHRGPVTGVEAVPGRPWVITSGYDGAVAAYSLLDRRVELLGYHRHLVNRVVVEPNGRRAASCSSDYTIGLWDLEGRRPIHSLLGHADDVEDFVFVDDHTGVSASRDRRIYIWDLDTGAVRNILEGHERDVLAIACNEGRIYSSGDDRTLRVWDLASGRQLRVWGPFEDETDTCALDPGRHRAVLGCDDGHVRVFDARTGALLADIAAHGSGIKKVAVSPATGDILSAAYDQRIVVWDAETFACKQVVQSTRATWERSLTWSPTGERILGGTFDGTVVLFDPETGALLEELGASSVPGNACLNDIGSAPGGVIATCSDDGIVRVGTLEPGGGAWRAEAEPPGGRVLMNAVTLSPDGGHLAAGSHDNRLLTYAVEPGGLVLQSDVNLRQGPINSVRFGRTPDSAGDVFVACYSGVIARVGADGVQKGAITHHEGAVKALRLHPEKPIGVSCGADGLLLSWTLDGALHGRYQGHSAIINDVDLEPSGESLASVSRDFTVKVYRLADQALTHSVSIGRRSLKSVCFWSPERVFVGDYWGAVVAVDLTTGGVATRRTVARNGISALGRHGPWLVAVSYEGCALLLSPDDLSEVGRLTAMQQRLDPPWEGWGIRGPIQASEARA